ncbi:MAG TPA: spermidine/putrescine ABC transporter substrate-binding protein [Gaiellaceae bacterium]|nr:spermidine/putrescine ABC transporter substrate-binding protein [Gaiellaceae bacterium]
MSDQESQEQPFPDPALLRGLSEPRISRGQLVRRAGAGALAFGLAGFLEACGVGGANKTTSTTSGANQVGSAEWWAKQKVGGTLQFANWPLYIDTSHGKHPSLQQFTKATGIKVNYEEVIQNNDSFYAKIAPSLQGGQGTGYDIIVMTNGWYLTELINHRWLIPLDHSKIPNFFKYASTLYKNPNYDGGNKYTVAWQSGFTGIAYNPQLTGREINSVDDLWDPKFSGHIGMMSDNTELGSVALLKLGIEPATSTVSDWHKAASILKQQRKMVRQYYDQSYIKALENGDTWITQAWSGDIFQANASGYPHLKFVVPKEGVMHWTDNMMIPLHAPHPADALSWMNFYYQPKIAAEVADWVNYLCPVPAAKSIIAKQLDDPSVAKSPLVFPSKAMSAKAKEYYTFKNFNEFNTWNNIFNPIIQS